MSELQITPKSVLQNIPTCKIQWELDRREGVQSKSIGIADSVEITVNGTTWVNVRGPLTVSVNQD